MYGKARPVPSRAALHVLRGLAYVTSGTACGTAAIVLEEQRRRACIVHQVADNARRLKQHPRRLNNTASEPSESRADFLPSKVDASYDKWASRQACHDRPTRPAKHRLPATPSFAAQGLPSKLYRSIHSTIHPNRKIHSVLIGDGQTNTTQRLAELAASGDLADIIALSRDLHNQNHWTVAHMAALRSNISRLLRDYPSDHLCDFLHQACIRWDTPPSQLLLKAREQFDILAILCSKQLDSSNTKLAESIRTAVIDHYAEPKASLMLQQACNGLLHSDQPSSAASLLRFCTADISVTDVHCDTASAILSKSLESEDFKTTKQIITWKQSHGLFVHDDLNRLLTTLVATRDHHMIALLIADQNSSFQVDTNILPDVVIAHLAIKHLDQAVALSCRILDPTAVSVSKWLFVLDALLLSRWRVCRNLSLVEHDLDTLLGAVTNIDLRRGLYNSMLTICAKAGATTVAQRLCKRMQEQHGISADLKTLGSILHAVARTHDWAAVDALLKLLHSSDFAGFSLSQQASFFNPIIHEYASTHKPRQLMQFATTLFEDYGLVFRHASFSIVFKTLVRYGDLSAIKAWLQEVSRQGAPRVLNASDASDAMQCFYRSKRPSQNVMYDLLGSISNRAQHLVSDQLNLLLEECKAYDLRALAGVNVTKKIRKDITQAALKSTARLRSLSSSSAKFVIRKVATQQAGYDADDTVARCKQNLVHDKPSLEYKQMLLAFSVDDYQGVLDIYESRLATSSLPAVPSAINMVVQAQTRQMHSQGSYGLVDSVERGTLIGGTSRVPGAPMAIQRLRDMARREPVTSVEQMADVVKSYYKDTYESGCTISHYVAVTAAKDLLRLGRIQDCVELLRNVYSSPWTATQPLDIAAMAVLLEGYAYIGSSDGIDWVMNRTFESGIRLSLKFVRFLSYWLPNRLRKRPGPHKDAQQQQAKVTALLESILKWREPVQLHFKAQKKETEAQGKALVGLLIEHSRVADSQIGRADGTRYGMRSAIPMRKCLSRQTVEAMA